MPAERDLFERLHLPASPVAPDPLFASRLRAQVAEALTFAATDAVDGPRPSDPPTHVPEIALGRRTTMSTSTPTPSPADSRAVDPVQTPAVRFENPSLVVRGGAAAVAFYQAVFGATISMEPFIEPDGRIGHVELDIGGAMVALADEYPEYQIFGPKTLGGTPVALGIRVPSPEAVDALVALAVANGAEVVFEVKDQFYGERAGRIRDPWGHEWMVHGLNEQLTVAEMQDRFEAEGGGLPPTDTE